MPERFFASVLPQHEAAELYRLMVVGIREIAVFLMDPGGYVTVWNKAAQDMKGYTPEEILGQHLAMLYTDEDRARGHPNHNLQRAAEDGFYSEETWRKRKDGTLFFAHIALTALRDSHNVLVGFSKVTMDLTRHKLLQQCKQERDDSSFLQMLQFHEPGGVGTIIEAVDRCLKEKRVVSSLPHLTMLSRDGPHYSVESAVAPVILDNGELIGAVLIFHDVTESKRLMRRLGFEASHDALTGLVNRREFEVRLKRALERAHSPGGDTSALLYMDLDQFKIVNDTCGHSAGDDLLKLLASSYAEHVRERDTLARIGGDEFALIVEHCDVDEAMAVAQKMLDATRNFRYACKGRLFQLGVSIGLTPIDNSTTSVEEAMRRADCRRAAAASRSTISAPA